MFLLNIFDKSRPFDTPAQQKVDLECDAIFADNNGALLYAKRFEFRNELCIKPLVFILKNLNSVNRFFIHVVVRFRLKMDRQNRQQLTEVVLVKHSDDSFVLRDFVKVPCDILELVGVYLFVDKVFYLFFTLNVMVYFTT
jgi:hypothetical protein